MTAVLLYTGSAPWASSIVPYIVMLTIVPVCLVFAPQKVREDRRIKVTAILLILLAISAPSFAAVTSICDWAWWAIECWFLPR